MDGIEVTDGTRINMLSDQGELLTRRHEGMQRTKDFIYEQIANNQFPMEETEFVVRCLGKRADSSARQTYVDGKRVSEVSEGAIAPRVGMTLMAGADTPQVNRMEQVGMARETPDQKSAAWRVNTAGTLLHDFDVDTDLSIIQSDNTSRVIARYRERNSASNTVKHALMAKEWNDRTVTIHSDHVEIVKDLSNRSWDLESTLIEVDGSSLTSLMVNYRHLIYRGGPSLTFAETTKLLDIMIEDARRLYIRSPILFRMSTRRHIMSSRNTRYGVDHGLIFRTLTTSRGIKNIISLSASYFNALSTLGNKDKSQESIRPRFLQMLVLLLSLLNDNDLGDLREFLETTYRIKADRQSLEILILKVLPLMSINSKVFIHALVTAVDGHAQAELDTPHPGTMWNIFVQRLLHLGFMLPGTVAQLGQTGLSWVIKWPEDGIKDSHVFRNLQSVGRSQTMNEIPFLDLSLGCTLDEVTVIFTNGAQYLIGHDDLERIVCMTPGTYSLADNTFRSQNHGLEIDEVVVNATVYDTIFRLNRIIAEYNGSLPAPRRHSSVLTMLASYREKPRMTPFKEIKGSGRLTRHIAKLDGQILAVAYKVEGRKITRRDLLRHLASDIGTLNAVARVLESVMQDHNRRSLPAKVRDIVNKRRPSLVKIRDQIAQADNDRARIADRKYAELGDEPISKVLYPNGSHRARSTVWHEYRSFYAASENILHVDAQRQIVEHVRWITEDLVEVSFYGFSAIYLLSPLATVAEGERADEIRANDAIILVGHYVVVVELGEGQPPQAKEAVTNWLKIIGVEQYPVSRRGMNRTDDVTKILPRWTFR